jgi:uncharacterized protein (UPF0332 family)
VKPKERENLIRHRIDLSRETVKETERLLENPPHLRGAINRVYYALFYSLQALAISKEIIISKHTHAISFFDKEFVKEGIFDKTFSKLLHNIFDLRLGSDYRDFLDVNAETVKEYLLQSKSLIKAIERYLDKGDT